MNGGGKAQTDIRRLPLVELVSIIVRESSREALCEFHDCRTVFAFREHNGLRLAEYVACLRDSAFDHRDDRVADIAYSLTIDKFNRLPGNGSGADSSRPNSGIDCRNYFRPFLAAMADHREPQNVLGPLGMEYAAARVLQGLVCRHFHLSIREARRQASPAMSRYTWKLPQGALTVMMPAEIGGRMRKDWLEQNVQDPDPRRPDERQRVQAIIDEQFGSRAFHYRDELDSGTEQVVAHIRPPWSDAPDVVYELAEAVADEKADTIEEQRTTIRNRGTKALRSMIHSIFSILAEEEVSDGDIARHVGMDKVTYSRFAGTRWGGRTSIPDLWANTAQVLASNPDFIRLARQRVRDRVGQIVYVTGQGRHRRTNRD
jgi:hypothetical protein